MNSRGQGALEYLLLIGGALVVAVVVITLLTGISGPVGQQTGENAALALCKNNGCTGNVTISGQIYSCQGTVQNCVAGVGLPNGDPCGASNECASGYCDISGSGNCENPPCDGDGACEAGEPQACSDCSADSDSDGVINFSDNCDGSPGSEPSQGLCSAQFSCGGTISTQCTFSNLTGCQTNTPTDCADSGQVCNPGTGQCESSSDATPPTVTLTVPADGSTVSGSIILTATATDAVGVDRVEFSIGSNGPFAGTPGIGASYNYTWNTTTATEDSSVIITATGYDTSNNQASDSATVTVNNYASLGENCSAGSGKPCDPNYTFGSGGVLQCSTGDICLPNCSQEFGQDGCLSGEPCLSDNDCHPSQTMGCTTATNTCN